ncbi:uncharacterized protein LOC144159168 isoform X2 [Haemaphysalis longicornis]
MPDGNLHRVRGFVSGVNWRVTKFATAVPHHLTCGLCRVISPTTILLPCSHALCESCASNGVLEGDDVCPFDAEPFTAEECPRFHLQAAASNKLRACCWNETHGCTFAGTLHAVLTHYEEECTFHAVTCQRCSGTVLQQELPRDYRADCHGSVIGSATGDATILQGAVLGTDDIGSSIDAFKALLSNFYEDRLPAIQSTINELLETARSTDSAIGAIRVSCEESEQRITQATRQPSATFATQLQSQQCALSASLKENFPINEISEEVMNHGRRIDEMTRALSDSKPSLSDQIAQATRELSATLGRELQYQQATMASDLKKHLDMNETSEQVKSQCMRIDAIAKKLHDLELRSSHQLAEAVEELSKTFAKKLESQRRQLCTHLKQMSELETSSPAAAGTTSTSEMPWRLEKRHILRKLELVATDSHAYLELLRTIADQKLQRPVVEYRPVLPDSLAGTKIMPPLMGNGENEEGYTVSITNVYDVVKSDQFIFLLNRWYRRDRYLQVATYGWSCYVEQTLTVCVKWGTTTQGLCSASQEARVWVKHPDYPKKENLHVRKLGSVGSRAALLGFQENFALNLLELERSGLVRDAKLTLIVLLKI